MQDQQAISWNPQVKLIVSDVDETIADNYLPAVPEMIQELTLLLKEGKILFLVTGASIKRIQMRITDFLAPELRKNVLAAHCSGAEVWGFTQTGELRERPFYSLYEGALTNEQKTKWRAVIQQLIVEFRLSVHEPMGAIDFLDKTQHDPFSIIMEDRGPQITFEFINSYNMSPDQREKVSFDVPLTNDAYDMRIPVMKRAEELLQEAGVSITPRLAGQWAIDFALAGVNKTTAIKKIISDESILTQFGLTKEEVATPELMEIWGDKFSAVRGGTDRYMCEALPPQVRAIDFRAENPEEFPKDYSIVLWNGKNHTQDGLLEYLQSRHSH